MIQFPWKDILTFYLPKLPAKNFNIESWSSKFWDDQGPKKLLFLGFKSGERSFFSLGKRSQGGGLPWHHGWIERNSRGSCQCQGCICNFGGWRTWWLVDGWGMWGWQCTQSKFFLRESVVFSELKGWIKKEDFQIVSGKSCKKNLKCHHSCHTWMILPLSFLWRYFCDVLLLTNWWLTLWVSVFQVGLLHCSTHPWWFSVEMFKSTKSITGWRFQTFFIFTWRNDPIWLAHIFQNGWEKTPTRFLYFHDPQKKVAENRGKFVSETNCEQKMWGIPC